MCYKLQGVLDFAYLNMDIHRFVTRKGLKLCAPFPSENNWVSKLIDHILGREKTAQKPPRKPKGTCLYVFHHHVLCINNTKALTINKKIEKRDYLEMSSFSEFSHKM